MSMKCKKDDPVVSALQQFFAFADKRESINTHPPPEIIKSYRFLMKSLTCAFANEARINRCNPIRRFYSSEDLIAFTWEQFYMKAQDIKNRSLPYVRNWLKTTARNQRCNFSMNMASKLKVTFVENVDSSTECIASLIDYFMRSRSGIFHDPEVYCTMIIEMLHNSKKNCLSQLNGREREMINYTLSGITTLAEQQHYLNFPSLDAFKSSKKRTFAKFR